MSIIRPFTEGFIGGLRLARDLIVEPVKAVGRVIRAFLHGEAT